MGWHVCVRVCGKLRRSVGHVNPWNMTCFKGLYTFKVVNIGCACTRKVGREGVVGEAAPTTCECVC